jgi:hypothetical protein
MHGRTETAREHMREAYAKRLNEHNPGPTQ